MCVALHVCLLLLRALLVLFLLCGMFVRVGDCVLLLIVLHMCVCCMFFVALHVLRVVGCCLCCVSCVRKRL